MTAGPREALPIEGTPEVLKLYGVVPISMPPEAP